ncbi:MAG: glycosyltransferase family 2 protein [Fimbriimonas ginsengisoli]|uniref:dolichyl-phosphate beta-glucosyltransferase n=1 Tax=Fimbriimonas ginsengisoli TaxID=1005039 RepID=A0A931PUA3_FIMGI|nr:glycosyltransferase family 2 protein [Fimbriimonas ginsengisoli]MBI3722127.1 glycosyltransferase family 2 protein [Fimbriimonas ginsengisoli]
MSLPHLTVVVPAYNEASRLGPSLGRIAAYYRAQAYPWNVIVADDGSTDDTRRIATDFAKGNPEFTVLSYSPNRGKGCAVRTGMLAAEGDIVLFMDADLATPLEETGKLLPHLAEGAQGAIGSRPLRESRLERRQPKWREAIGRLANKLIQTFGVRGIQDTQCGFKMFTREAAHEIFRRSKLDGFSFDFEALMLARDLGYRIDEVPIRWAHQEGSKVVFWRDYPRALRDLVKLRLMGRKRRMSVVVDAEDA